MALSNDFVNIILKSTENWIIINYDSYGFIKAFSISTHLHTITESADKYMWRHWRHQSMNPTKRNV